MHGTWSFPNLIATLFAGMLLAFSATAADINAWSNFKIGARNIDLVELFPHGTLNANDGELVMGSYSNRAEHEGVTYLFSSAENAKKFTSDPMKYLPGAGGYCLLGLYRRAVDAPTNGALMPPPGDPAARTYANGKWYFHAGVKAEKLFEEVGNTINERAAIADKWFNQQLVTNIAGKPN